MKRNFLLLGIFFLSACASDDFPLNSDCPVSYGQLVDVQFEYGSAELNEKAVQQMKEIAKEARENDSFVCFLGRLSYRGVPSFQATGALDRVKNTAAIFLKEGVEPANIYIGMKAENPKTGFSNPQTAAQEEHILNILVGK